MEETHWSKDHGRALRERRRRRGLSQEDLAEAAGVDAKTLRALEQGKREPRYGTLRAIATHVIEAGQKRADAGDTEGARAHYAAVKECGKALASPQRLQLVQMAGKAMAELAQQELEAAP